MKSLKLLLSFLLFSKIIYAQEVIEFVPDSMLIKSKVHLANAEYLMGNYDQIKTKQVYLNAIGQYDAAIEWGFMDSYIYFERGFCKYQVEDYKGAVIDFTTSLKMYNEIITIKSGWLRSQSSYIKTSEGYQEIPFKMSLEVKILDCYSFRGSSKMALTDYRGAISDFSELLSYKDNDFENYYYGRGFCYGSLKNYKDAIADMTSALNINNENAEYYYLRGIYRINIEQFEEGCMDLSYAGQYGKIEAYDLIKKYCK